MRDNSGWTPLTAAAEGGSAIIIARLIKAGASLKELDNRGESPLSHALKKGNVEAAETLRAYDK
jgi:ankyrin repeat protein